MMASLMSRHCERTLACREPEPRIPRQDILPLGPVPNQWSGGRVRYMPGSAGIRPGDARASKTSFAGYRRVALQCGCGLAWREAAAAASGLCAQPC